VDSGKFHELYTINIVPERIRAILQQSGVSNETPSFGAEIRGFDVGRTRE
jgi:hypothetical protein